MKQKWKGSILRCHFKAKRFFLIFPWNPQAWVWVWFKVGLQLFTDHKHATYCPARQSNPRENGHKRTKAKGNPKPQGQSLYIWRHGVFFFFNISCSENTQYENNQVSLEGSFSRGARKSVISLSCLYGNILKPDPCCLKLEGILWFPGGSDSKECLQCGWPEFDPWVGKISWRKWQPTSVFLPGKSHGQRSLMGYSPWGRKELDTTEWLHFHFLFEFQTLLGAGIFIFKRLVYTADYKTNI